MVGVVLFDVQPLGLVLAVSFEWLDRLVRHWLWPSNYFSMGFGDTGWTKRFAFVESPRGEFIPNLDFAPIDVDHGSHMEGSDLH